MLDDRRAHARQLQQNSVWQHGSGASRASDLLDATAGARPHLDLLPPLMPLHDLPAVARVAEDEVVRRDQTTDQGLAEAGAGLDDGLVARARDRIRGEHHAGHIRGNHSLHDDGQLNRHLRESVLLAVGDGTIAPEGCPAAADGVEQCSFAAHPQKRLLLAGECRLWQVLRRRARADGNGPPTHAAVAFENGLFHFRRNRRFFEPGPNQRGITPARGSDDIVLKFIAPHHEVVSGRGDDKSRGDREPCAQQFAQVGGLAAAMVEISDAKLGQIDDKD